MGQPVDKREIQISLALFLATLVSVFVTYGWLWSDGDPWSSKETAIDCAVFAGGLMSILGAHELGHWVVARRHGFSLSLPYFIPIPVGFGTFGAIIRLHTLPRSRTALLEMGAAGPLAGMVVAVLCLVLGLPDTGPMVMPAIPEVAAEPSAWVQALADGLDSMLAWGPMPWLVDAISPPVPEGHVPVLIFNNPPIMDLIGTWILGAPPGRFDTLSPLALAGWVGCFLTALNLVPIGQLDGGHVLNALTPRHAPRISRIFLGLVLAGGLFWSGWVIWGALLWRLGAWQSLEVPARAPLSGRARWIAAATALVFLLTFRAQPIELDSVPVPSAPPVVNPG
jgi:membrane-associated protease RseP (regulator of RpoE activity)